MIIPLFKKSKLKKILSKYTKLIENETFINLRKLEIHLKQLFYEESKKNCKFYKLKEEHPLEQFCTHKKGTGVCDIWLCPYR
jgi:vacuolar-type H+-ATPase subunit C/Vma6